MIPEPFAIRISSSNRGKMKDLFDAGPIISVGGKEFALTECNVGGREVVVFAQEFIRMERTWSGEGLPPIGSHVVVHDDGSLVYGHGESGEVLAHVDGYAVIRMSYGLGCFLPRCLRTSDQVAEEEGVNAIHKFVLDRFGMSDRDAAAKLYHHTKTLG